MGKGSVLPGMLFYCTVGSGDLAGFLDNKSNKASEFILYIKIWKELIFILLKMIHISIIMLKVLKFMQNV